jgi:F0F1-type ATP synthase membrane subunit b/b'
MEAINDNFELVSEEADSPTTSTSEEISEEEEASYEVDMSEHIDALLAGEDLSEDFRQKATTIFEAAVKQKLEEEVAILEKAFEQTLEEEVERIQEELSNNVDDYLNYVVEQWVTDNEVAIQESLRTELTEDFISGLRNLFAENYIDIPEDKVNVVEELAGKVDELEGKLNEEIERNVALNKVLSESMRVEVLNDSLDGLTDTQAEKLKALAEGIDYTDVDQYKNKVKTLRENYFPSSIANPSEPLDQAVSASGGRSMISEETGPMAKYVQVLGKTLPT